MFPIRKVIGGLISVGCILLLFYSYREHVREDAVKDSTILSLQKEINDSRLESSNLKEELVNSKRNTDSLLAEVEAERSKARSNQQILAYAQKKLEKLIPGLVMGTSTLNNTSTPGTPGTIPPSTESPELEATISIPKSSLPALRDSIARCMAGEIKLKGCETDMATQAKLILEADKREKALQSQVESLKTFNKGGTFLHRVARNGKWFLVGAGVGAVVGAVASR